MSRVRSAAEEARAALGLPFAPTVAQAGELLEQWGAQPFDLAPHRGWFMDEHVGKDAIVASFAFNDSSFLWGRATAEEREMFRLDPEEDEFNPLEYGPDQADEATLAHEIEILERVVVAIEHAPGHTDRVGGFRAWGGGQWVREWLWAVTGVVPRDPGPVDMSSRLAPFFGRAFVEVGREPFTNDPIPSWHPRR